MKKKSSPLTFSFQIVVLLLLALTFMVGCSHKKTNRGHLYRCEWAFEHNRTPWIGCPPDSGCDDQRGCGASDCCEGDSGGSGILNCFKKDNGKHCCCKDEKNKGFRRHCGMNPECTSKRPCCRTLGCGMWVDPSDPNTFAALGGGVKACGLTAFCSPMKPCCLTPNCGRVVNQSFMNQQMLMLGNNAMPMQGGMQGMPVQGMPVTPTPVVPKGQPGNEKNNKKPPTVAGPTGMLISRGIVPGASPIANGGVVAALGVTTPIGMMTPAGVRLPNGMVNANAVIRACSMPGCSAARPCGMTPGCGGLVSVTAVSVNPMMLASATYPNGGVMQAGAVPGYATGGMMTAGGIPMNRTGNGMLVNPVTGQVVAGLTMNGYPQNGYPPIGYAPTGYSPGFPRYAGMNAVEVEEEAEEEPEAGLEESAEAEQRSPMPVPRFHPIPSKPVFQRSEGMPVPNRTGPGEKRAANGKRIFSDDDLNAVVEQAYLEGMSDAMDEVEEELEAQAQELAKSQLQEKILNQAKKLQTQIETQKDLEIRALEMQKRQELAETKAREKAAREKAAKAKAARELAAMEVAQAAEQETRLRQLQASQMMQTPIPTGFEQTNQAVYPVNYATNYGGNEFAANGSGSNGAGKNIFVSAAQFLKGSGEKPSNPYAASMPAPYIPQRQAVSPQYNRQVSYAQQAYGRQDSGSSFDLAATGGNLWNSAKSMGNNVVSAVNGAVSPLSGLLGSDKPQMPYPAQYPMPYPTAYPTPQTRRTAAPTGQAGAPQAALWPTLSEPMTAHAASHAVYPCPCPPCPPFDTTKAARSRSNVAVASATHDEAGEIDFSRMNLPKKPPTLKKKPKRMIEVDNFEEEGSMILQANYEEE